MNRRIFPIISVVACLALAPSEARAGSWEHDTSRDINTATMAAGLPIAVGFDIACAVYLGIGDGDSTAGLIVGIGSLLVGGSMMTASSFAMEAAGDIYSPSASTEVLCAA